MHGHHPQLVACDVHVALYLCFACAQPRDKALQSRRFVALIDQCVLQEFVERVGGFRPEPRIEAGAPTLRPEDARIECERRKMPRPICGIGSFFIAYPASSYVGKVWNLRAIQLKF